MFAVNCKRSNCLRTRPNDKHFLGVFCCYFCRGHDINSIVETINKWTGDHVRLFGLSGGATRKVRQMSGRRTKAVGMLPAGAGGWPQRAAAGTHALRPFGFRPLRSTRFDAFVFFSMPRCHYRLSALFGLSGGGHDARGPITRKTFFSVLFFPLAVLIRICRIR